jgi:hypothetical protein
MLRDEDRDRQRIAELELQQAQYDVSLAERRYAACDHDNRLIAAQLERAWETALERVERYCERLDRMGTPGADNVRPDSTGLADDLSAAWKAPRTTMRTRQRLVRTLITEIVVDVDAAAGETGQDQALRVLAAVLTAAARGADQFARSDERMVPPVEQKDDPFHRLHLRSRITGLDPTTRDGRDLMRPEEWLRRWPKRTHQRESKIALRPDTLWLTSYPHHTQSAHKSLLS